MFIKVKSLYGLGQKFTGHYSNTGLLNNMGSTLSLHDLDTRWDFVALLKSQFSGMYILLKNLTDMAFIILVTILLCKNGI